MSGGYMGKLLVVDLSNHSLREQPLDEAMCRQFLGGYGLGAKLLYDLQAPHTDPLGPSNHLGFLTGPLTGTPAIIGSRYVVVSKSPLTHTWGDANSGGYFGPSLKFAGYDGVIVTGTSDQPVYLLIDDGEASLRDAEDLWGKTTLETRDALKEMHGKDVEEACIGPAGEKCSLISCITTDYGRAAGRSGLGAVMGAKKLKAIAVRGRRKVPLADPERVQSLRKHYLQQATGFHDVYSSYGTCAITYPAALNGDSPVKNWRGDGSTDFPDAQQISDSAFMAEQERKYRCWGCPIGCGGHLKSKLGRNRPVSHKPEYETICAAGTLVLNGDLESIIRINDICNAYGMDTISAPATIAFAIECFENGLLTKTDTDGIDLRWGNAQAIVAVIEKMARREGIGDLLADGVKKAAERIGRGSEAFAIHIQGQEIPMHDPRFTPGLAVSYQIDATPARHTQGFQMLVPPGLDLPNWDKYEYEGKGVIHKKLVTLVHVIHSAGLCLFGYLSYPIQSTPDFLSAVTGWDISLDDCFTIGERIGNMRHAFNLREGLNPLAFKVPPVTVGHPPATEGVLKGIEVNQEALIQDYLIAMDWDLETTKPSRRKLEQLGLEYLITEL